MISQTTGYVGKILLTAALIFAIVSCCCISNLFAAERPIRLTLASYAVTQSAYKQIVPQFIKHWKETTGQTAIVDRTYSGSGAQTRAVIDGLEADVVDLALPIDVKAIETAGLIQPGWEQKFPNNGIVHKSVAAVVTRDRNMKIDCWSDLAQDNLEVIIANPKISGGARWNFLALWGSVIGAGGNEAAAQTFIEKVYQNVLVMPKDSRESSSVFYRQGQGNVLINYENEVIFAESKGGNLPYFVPVDRNISIDNPVAIVDAYADKHGTREVAEAFVRFLFTPEAQREFAKIGFRPVNEMVAKEFEFRYPKIENLFTAQDLGSWEDIHRKFFGDGAIFDRIFTRLS